MIPHAKYLDSVGAAIADEIFKQTDDGESKLKVSDSLRRGAARIMRRNQVADAPQNEQTQAPAKQEPIKNCV